MAGDLKQGIRCLCMHRLRAFLSTLGVLFGVVSVITMLAIGQGAKQEILTQVEQLGTKNIIIRQSELSETSKGKALEAQSRGLTIEDAQALKNNISVISQQASLKVIKGHISGVSQEVVPEILAITPSFTELKGLRLAEGRFIGDFDISQRNYVCILGAELAKSLGRWGHVGQTIRIENLPFQVIGILDNKQWVAGKNKTLSTRNLNKSLFIPLGVESGFPHRTAHVNRALSEIILQLTEPSQMLMGAEAVKRMMEVLHKGVEDYQMIIPHELLEQANQTQNIFNLVLGGIAALSMLVGGIGIMNIMLATISMRTREIGVRRSIGASKYHIAKQFLIETLILTMGGAVFGLIGGVILSNVIGFYAGWCVIVTGWSILLALGMAAGVGVASGLYPAFKAASMDPIIALRHI
jgi:putative ABC transport system permease protein